MHVILENRTLLIIKNQVFIDINHMYKYDQNPITRSWFIVKTHFRIITYWTLTFDLDLGSAFLSHKYQSYLYVPLRLNYLFMFYSQNNHKDTNAYRIALQLYWTRLWSPNFTKYNYSFTLTICIIIIMIQLCVHDL